ncbi:MAG: hypothetical protein NVS1B4_01040 [Gemmatimonadaceae bacterium]
MSYRALTWAGVSVLSVAILASCNDRPPRPSIAAPQAAPPRADVVTYTCDPARIAELALMLVPVPIDDPPLDLGASTTLVLSLTPTQLALAQSLVIQLAATLADDRVLALLRDPVTPTKTAAIAELINRLFVCVQLPPPGDIASAYTPGGAAAIIGVAGGTVLTRDATAAFVIPAGALPADRLVTIAPLSAAAKAKTCLPQGVPQYNQCYNFSISPSTPVAKAITLAMCTLATISPPFGTPSAAVHERLRMASVDHLDPTKITVYDRVPPPTSLRCENATLVHAEPGLGERMFGQRWTRMAGMLAKVTEVLTPTVAYAFDGLGCLLEPPALLTNFTTVDPVVYQTGFEPADAPWTTSGFWHASTLAGIRNTAVPTYVTLAAGDGSNGYLPAPFAGSYALWYGEDATGNFAGPLLANQPLKSGGTSVAPNSGVAASPAIAVPNTTNAIRLGLQSWYEIESVNPVNFDIMNVQVEDLADPTHARTVVARLNPAVLPGGSAPVPFTSGGFNVPPVWQRKTIDLSAYRGKTVRLYANFGTGDALYNGFRGWLIDDLSVTVASLTPLLTSTVPLSAAVVPDAPAAPAAAATPRVWRP